MFTINQIPVEIEHFPDGTMRIVNIHECLKNNKFEVQNTVFVETHVEICWNYPNDEECMALYFIVNHIRNNNPRAVIHLIMPYILNARMDRVKNKNEVFTLKWFADFINGMKFDSVTVLDAHSNVSLGLINNIRQMNVEPFIMDAIDDIEGGSIDGGEIYGGKTLIYFPDDGAMKRYADLKCIKDRDICFGKKNRDWATGQILGLEVYNRDGNKLTKDDVNGRVVLMIDDIISFGGTLAYSGDKLKELGAQAIYAYASHTEDSVLDEERGTLLKRLKNGTVDGIYTTDSIFTQHNNDYFTVYNILEAFKNENG